MYIYVLLFFLFLSWFRCKEKKRTNNKKIRDFEDVSWRKLVMQLLAQKILVTHKIESKNLALFIWMILVDTNSPCLKTGKDKIEISLNNKSKFINSHDRKFKRINLRLSIIVIFNINSRMFPYFRPKLNVIFYFRILMAD